MCTLSDSAATEDDGSVILGGPDGPLRRYECTDELRDHPGSTQPPSGEVTGA